MDVDEYASRRESLLRRMILALLWVFQQFLTPGMTRRDWLILMRTVYRVMKPFRDEGTQLAREFYDANRAAESNATSRHDIYTDDHYPEEWMQEALEPTYQNFQRTKNVNGAIQDISNRLVKVVEDGARRTLIKGVADDTDQEYRGWARFDPRPPTCAFCTMMISRGPVYAEAINAGLDLDNESAEELMRNVNPNNVDPETSAQLADLLNRWHPGCTCIVVPVYKRSGYITERQEREALAIYNSARRRAKEKTFKAILKEMRRDLYVPAKGEDEVTLPSVA